MRVQAVYATLRSILPWLVRAFVAWVLLGALVPAQPRAPLGAPQTVATTKPQLCMHTRLIDEVEEWKIQHSLELVREMGAPTIVEFFPWAYIEGTEDRYDWTTADRIIRQARNQGIHIIARLGLVPEWARSRGDTSAEFTTFNTLPEAAYPDFSEFTADFAARYAGVVNQIIIWNEPNLAFEWGYASVDPAAYARLLQAVYTPAHAANPNVVILAAGLAPTLEPVGSAAGLSDLLYLEALYQAGARDYFDALAIHTYGFTLPPEAPPAFDTLNFRRVELLREIMVRNGDADKPAVITETGWNDNPRWTKAVSPSQRIADTISALQWAEAHWYWLDKICFWVLRYPTPTLSYPDNFTFVTTRFQLKPIYYAVQAYARGFQQSEDLWLPAPG
jgi:polysaccharide biosynthesis protein PslG